MPEYNSGLINEGLGGTNLLGHVVEGNAVGAGDMTFFGIVLPRGEDEDVSGSDRVKQAVGWFIIVAETVVGEEDDGMFFREENNHDFAFLRRDEWRDTGAMESTAVSTHAGTENVRAQ